MGLSLSHVLVRGYQGKDLPFAHHSDDDDEVIEEAAERVPPPTPD